MSNSGNPGASSGLPIGVVAQSQAARTPGQIGNNVSQSVMPPAERARGRTRDGPGEQACGVYDTSLTKMDRLACGPLSMTGFRSAARCGTWVSRRGPILASGSTRAESTITRIGSCIPTMDQIKKTIPDGLPTGV